MDEFTPLNSKISSAAILYFRLAGLRSVSKVCHDRSHGSYPEIAWISGTATIARFSAHPTWRCSRIPGGLSAIWIARCGHGGSPNRSPPAASGALRRCAAPASRDDAPPVASPSVCGRQIPARARPANLVVRSGSTPSE